MTQAIRDASQNSQTAFDLTVRSVETIADEIVALVVESADGKPLPAWEPGAHIDLVLTDELVRQYSLCGDPTDSSSWRMGILREPKSRGGSEFIHTNVSAGSRISARGPRNNFPLVAGKHYRFVAGGIGITPLLPMISQLNAAGADWSLLYGGRTASSMAFLEELRQYGDRVTVRPQDEYGLLDIVSFLSHDEDVAEVYCCGPEPLITAIEAVCESNDSIDLHVERFSPKELDGDVIDESFEVDCTSTGITLQIPPGKSILEVAKAAGIDIMSSCSEGTCGTCETDVIEGIPEHRDSILTPEERKAGESIMVCVSRCIGKRIVLDL